MTPAGALKHTVDLLLVDVLDRVIIGVGGGEWLVEGVVEVAVMRNQAVEQACAAVVATLDVGFAATGGEIRQAEDGGVRVLLVVHGVAGRLAVTGQAQAGRQAGRQAARTRPGVAAGVAAGVARRDVACTVFVDGRRRRLLLDQLILLLQNLCSQRVWLLRGQASRLRHGGVAAGRGCSQLGRVAAERAAGIRRAIPLRHSTTTASEVRRPIVG